MSTITRPSSVDAELPELHSGDRMTQKEFHRIYEQMPEDFRAELIGGIVYVSSPLKRQHGVNHLPLGSVLFAYKGHTPGVECGDNATLILGESGEPQPDLFLRILPEFGGQSKSNTDDYIVGGPEWIGEIALTSKSIDLHSKLQDYREHDVQEYFVVCVREQTLRWFDLQTDDELHPDADGVYRMRKFPGLWIHGQALLAQDYQRLMATLQEGLASPEHAAFVARLQASAPIIRG